MLQRLQPAGAARIAGNGWIWVILILGALLFFPIGVRAEEQALTVQLAGLTADDWPQAQAVVTVLGEDGRPVAELGDGHFQAQLNGSGVPVVAVEQGVDSSLAVEVVLALDISGSMEGGALEQAKVAAQSFLGGLAFQDRVAVVTFHNTVDLILPFTQDRAAVEAAIQSLTAGGGTALYQATAESIRLAAGTESSRRAVVLLSDGVDNGSLLTRPEALAPAETLGVPVFAIGLGADIDREYLQELAQVSGGRAAETPSPDGLAQLYQEAAEALRGQYILTLDASELALDQSDAVTLRVDAVVGELAGSDERAVCPQQLCVALSGVQQGDRLEEERTVVADVIPTEALTSVTFLMDGEPLLEVTAEPYEVALDSRSLSEGEHAFAVEVVTTSGETERREVTVLHTAVATTADGGGISSNILVFGAILGIAAVGAVLLILLLRRRRRRMEAKAPDAAPEPEPESEPAAPAPGGPRRPLWEEEAPQPPPEPERELGRLHSTTGPLTGQTFPVGDTPISIGTGHRCLVRLDDSEDGREIGVEHARIWIRDGQLVMHELRRLSDLGSTGGRWEFLDPGDVFAIGPYTFRFELTAGDGEETGEVPNILRSANYGGDEGGQEAAAVEPGASPSQNVETQGERSGAGTSADGNDSERTGAELPSNSRLHSDEEVRGEEQSPAASAEGGNSPGSSPQFRVQPPPQPPD
jgi:uncharacterized protein YegL